MPGQFDLQPTFPIAGVADLIANRPVKEAQMRAQQQQQLVQGLQTFGQGVQSLVDRRNMMAQALTQSQVWAKMHPEISGPTQVTTQAPVMRNQTAAYDPASGTVTPNTGMSGVATTVPQTTTTPSSFNPQDLQTAFQGLSPKDFLQSMTQDRAAKTAQGELTLKQQTEPKRLEIEGRKATAEEENAKVQRLIQGMLAGATIKNQAQERTQAAENATLEANKETAKHFFLHPIDAYNASHAISNAGTPHRDSSKLVSFASEGEAEKANLPDGTPIIVNGVKGTWRHK